MCQRGAARRGQPSRGRAVRHQFVQRAVARDAAGAEHRAGLPRREAPGAGGGRREEAGSRRVVDGPDPGHVQQRGGRRPAHRRHQQVGVDPRAAGQHHPLGAPPGALGRDHGAAGARVHELHRYPRGVQIGRGGVARLVGAEDHGPAPRAHRPQVQEAARSLRQHHARTVVAGEHVGALDEARRHDEHLGTRLGEPFGPAAPAALDDAEPVVLPAAGHGGVGEDLHARGARRAGQFGGERPVAAASPAEVPAERMLVLHEQHARPGLGRRRGRGEARRPPAGHDDIGVGVALLVAQGLAVRVDHAAGREAGQHLLVGGPQPPRPHERLVVEARAEGAPAEAGERLGVESQRRPGVLGRNHHARFEQPVAAPHVRLVAHLHQGVGVPVVGGQHAAWPVVLHAAGEHPAPGGRQRRDDRVARVARHAAPVPGEGERAIAVDHLARPCRQPVAAAPPRSRGHRRHRRPGRGFRLPPE